MNKMWLLLLLCCVPPVAAATLPVPDHIVIVMEENHAFGQIIGSTAAPYINMLAQRGMLFTRSYGVSHPSQPNYLALFSGSTQGINNDACPLAMSGPNLGSSLMAHGLSFATYAESMPAPGYTGCSNGAYWRKHNPAANWPELAATNLPFSAFPTDYAQLPTLSLVVPDQLNDMHDGTVAQGDAWLRQHIEPYAQWAQNHNSLLIVTWDEDNGQAENHIVTLLVGAHVKRGSNAQRIDHYNLLRTLEQMYSLPLLGETVDAAPIKGVWRK